MASLEETPCWCEAVGRLMPTRRGDLNFQVRVAVEQEMAEQAAGIVIVAAALPEGKGRLEQAALLGRQSLFGNLCLGEPACAGRVRGGHEKSSLQSRQREL